MGGWIWTRQARLADIPRLYEILNLDSAGVARKNWSLEMRSLFELCRGNVVLAASSRQKGLLEEAEAALLAGVQIIDPEGGRALLHVINQNENMQQHFWDELLDFCFGKLNLYRLEVQLTKGENSCLEPEMLENTGWTREAVLRNAGFSHRTNTHHDVVMYSIIRPCFKMRAAAFVFFNRGVFTIYGTAEHILAAAFAHYDSVLDEYWQQESAEILNLLEDGKLKRWNQISAISDNRYLISNDSLAMVNKAASQASEYFQGERKIFELEYSLNDGSEFQTKVWRSLADIPYGATWSYEEMAEHINDADDREKARKMARAIGRACATNPISLFLPCHRVIGKDGKLTGFGGGLDIKEYLLEHEMFSF